MPPRAAASWHARFAETLHTEIKAEAEAEAEGADTESLPGIRMSEQLQVVVFCLFCYFLAELKGVRCAASLVSARRQQLRLSLKCLLEQVPWC